MTTPRTTPSTPSTAIPTMRNGIRRIQTRGYASNANKATGQQTTSKMHQTRNVPTPGHTILCGIGSGKSLPDQPVAVNVDGLALSRNSWRYEKQR